MCSGNNIVAAAGPRPLTQGTAVCRQAATIPPLPYEVGGGERVACPGSPLSPMSLPQTGQVARTVTGEAREVLEEPKWLPSALLAHPARSPQAALQMGRVPAGQLRWAHTSSKHFLRSRLSPQRHQLQATSSSGSPSPPKHIEADRDQL
ncbi:hypothetical protein NDU88_006328 [Pleurodeles waltl]|uniref:Uncharacterized protein n=1 Tax=Pleurodeles waltl TaxID=8319 RepID=A0AAV7VR84_PLEWA|nr:hypothetical protein NDU88_006328 [Pleurodeles waltl]